MNLKEEIARRENAWEGFTKVSTYSIIVIMAILGLMAFFLV